MSNITEATVGARVIRGLARLMGVSLQGEEPEPKGSTADPSLDIMLREWERLFALSSVRKRRYADHDRMDVGDLATLLDTVVDSCLISDDGRLFGFNIDAPKKIKNLLDDTRDRLGIINQARESLRDCLKYGDEFVAVTVADNGLINFLQPLPVGTMLARVDQHNRLLQGEEVPRGGREAIPAAYWQMDDTLKPIAGWYPWEMKHLKYRPTGKNPYSATSLFEDARARWHKLRMMEEALTIARIIRAYIKYVHKIDATGKTTAEAENVLKNYMDRVKQTKLAADSTTGSRGFETRYMGVDEDFFMTTGYIASPDGSSQPMLSGIDYIDPQNTGVRSIPDIEFMQRGIFTRVSGESVGIPGDREDVSMQDIASSRFYQWCQRGILENQFIRPIFDLQLYLRGYTPKSDTYKIIWPRVIIESSWRFADAGFRRSMMDSGYIESLVAPREFIARERFGWSEEEWNKEWLPKIKAEQEALGPLDRSSKAQQIRVGNQSSSMTNLDRAKTELLRDMLEEGKEVI